MAKRRMFSKDVIGTDWFTDMPATTQLLYIHLSMEADDDGFVTSVKTAMMNAHATKDDLAILTAKNYLIQLEQGLYLFKHWRMNNYIQKDRYQESPFNDRLVGFALKKDGSYTKIEQKEDCKESTNVVSDGDVYKMYTPCIQNVYAGKDSIGKYSIGKDSIEKDKKEIKLDKTTLKQSALCALLVGKGFLEEDELQDPSWDDLLNETVRKHGYVNTKIKLSHILEYATKESHGSYNYLKTALGNEMEKDNGNNLSFEDATTDSEE